MDVEHHGNWFATTDGRWINLAHCDAVEPVSVGGAWEIQAWNALQPHVDAYVLWRGDQEAEARKTAAAIVQMAAQAASQ